MDDLNTDTVKCFSLLGEKKIKTSRVDFVFHNNTRLLVQSTVRVICVFGLVLQAGKKLLYLVALSAVAVVTVARGEGCRG